jgi:hypothetical protein
MPGAISISSSPSFGEGEDAALGDVEYGLALGYGIGPGKGDMLDLFEEFLHRSLPVTITNRSSLTEISRPPAVKVPTKTTFLAF